MHARVNRRGLMLTAAFFLGLGVGLAGMDKHHDRAAAHAERDDGSLIAVFAGGLNDIEQRFLYEIDLYNSGAVPVEIGAARLLGPGDEVPPASEYPPQGDRRLDPNTWLTLEAVRGPPICPEKPVEGYPVLAVDVITRTGDVRNVQVPMLDQYGSFIPARTTGCDAVRRPQSAIVAHHRETVLGTGGTAIVTVIINNPSRRSVDIVAIASAGDVELETGEALPITIAPLATHALELKIHNALCQAATRGTDLTLTAEWESARTNHYVRLNPWLAPVMDDRCDGRP